MAIDTFIRVTVSSASATLPYRGDLVHAVARNTSNGGDVTVAFDKAKVGSVHVLQSVLDQVILALMGGAELTA